MCRARELEVILNASSERDDNGSQSVLGGSEIGCIKHLGRNGQDIPHRIQFLEERIKGPASVHPLETADIFEENYLRSEVIGQLHHRVEQLVSRIFLLFAPDGAESLARRAPGKHLYFPFEGLEPGEDGRISDIPLNDFCLWVVRPVGF